MPSNPWVSPDAYGKAAKPPAAGGGGDKKLTADEWLAEELKKQGK